MPGRVLTTASTIQCTHGAVAVLVTTNTRVSAGARVLRVTDTHTVTGCTHQRGSDPSPCTTIEWAAAASSVRAGGTAPLVTSSIGTCKHADGSPQGTALIVNTQQRVSAR
jgi:hypothetical protein